MATAEQLGAFNSAVASGDFSGAAAIAAAAGYSPADVATYVNANAAGLGLGPETGFQGVTGADVAGLYPGGDGGGETTATVSNLPSSLQVDQRAVNMLNQYYAAIDAGDINTARTLLSQAQSIYGPETLTNVAQDMLDRFNQTMTQAQTTGNFTSAANLVEAARQIYGEDTLQNMADYLNTDPKYQRLRDENKGTLFTPKNLMQFVQTVKPPVINKQGNIISDPPKINEQGNIISGPPDKVISGIPRFAAQTPSAATFAPLRRGLAQLRPAAFMPGLTSGQAPLGGSGFTPEQLRQASTRITQEGEAAGKTQEQILADFASLMDVGGVSPAELASATGRAPGELQGYYNQARPGGLFGTGAPAPRGLPEDFALQTGAYGAATPTFLARPEKPAPFPGQTNATANQPGSLGDVGGGITDYETSGSFNKTGGLIRMAEGGEPPKMSKLSAAQAGSTFDIADYIDEQGRLVGGFSRPVYDENRVITGYNYRPYERDVVFGRELREKEAAMRATDKELEQMMVEMAMRQGRTGVSPTGGGLAGIEIGDPMMRRRPQYSSTVEQFRPRYAEGGLASVAQNLADKGRKGDSMLVHMTPNEVAGLQALAQQMGGSLTINPETGLPEANFFKKLLPMALGFALGPAGAGIFSSALSAGLAVGAGYTLATGSLEQGISAGLGAYGGSNLGTGLQAAGTADAVGQAAANQAATDSAANVAGNLGGEAASAAMVDISALPPGTEAEFLAARPEFGQATSDALGGRSLGSFATTLPETTLAPGLGDPSSMSALELAETAPTAANTAYIPQAPTAPPATPGSALTGAERFLGDKATRDLAAERYAAETGSTLGTSAMQIAGGMAGQSAADAEQRIKAEQAAIFAKKEERKRRFDALFGRTLGAMPARSGGLMKLASGGMTYMEAGGTTGPTGAPRDVTGTGDGMSDSVPASIEGVQEARLADGEFVIPADVVADIGNGSSDAGSKKLYDMMDRIRKARHGTTKQPPEIRAERLMPA